MGDSLHFRAGSRKPGTAYLFYPHVDYHFRVRYPLRANPTKSSISPLFTSQKITTISPKIPSNPYKSILLSNSTENHIFNKETTHQKLSIYDSKITQITSKINTFSLYQIHKQYHSIEVIIFIIKFISNSHQKSTPNNISSHYHLITSPSSFLTCNH